MTRFDGSGQERFAYRLLFLTIAMCSLPVANGQLTREQVGKMFFHDRQHALNVQTRAIYEKLCNKPKTPSFSEVHATLFPGSSDIYKEYESPKDANFEHQYREYRGAFGNKHDMEWMFLIHMILNQNSSWR